MKEVNADEVYLKKFLCDIRDSDRQEILALDSNKFEEDFFHVCLDKTYETYFLSTDDDMPLAVGGAYCDKFSNIAKVWLLCTHKIDSNKKDVYKYVIDKIKTFQSKYDVLYNFIYKTNFSSLKWLKSCNFKALDLNNPDFKLFYFCKGDIKFDLRYFTC